MARPSIYFGIHSSSELAGLLPELKFHLVHIPEISEDALRQIKSYLGGRLVSQMIYDQGMPDLRSVRKLHHDFWSGNPQTTGSAILAIGGGSLMDFAKVLRFKPSDDFWLDEHLDIPMQEGNESLPLVLMPTTAGTGSEVTATATIWDFLNGKKHSFYGPGVMADVAVIDPELCLGAPWGLTRDSAIDALSHALESIWNIHANEETIELAVMASRNICLYLQDLKIDLSNLHARERLSEAALAAGLAMAQTQTALVHALSYNETIMHQKSHGMACGYWLPFVWKLVIDRCSPEVNQNLKKAIGDFFESPHDMAEWLLQLGIETHPLTEISENMIKKLNQLKATARGKNFLGFKDQSAAVSSHV